MEGEKERLILNQNKPFVLTTSLPGIQDQVKHHYMEASSQMRHSIG